MKRLKNLVSKLGHSLIWLIAVIFLIGQIYKTVRKHWRNWTRPQGDWLK